MPKYEVSIVIRRPVEDVFAFVENPKNDPIWRHSMVEAEVETKRDAKDDPADELGGEIGVGATGREVHERLGRKNEGTWEITEYEPNRKVAYKSTSGPVEYDGVWTYETVDGGTKLSFATQWKIIDREDFGKMSDRVFEGMYRKGLDGDLQSLKKLLEA